MADLCQVILQSTCVLNVTFLWRIHSEWNYRRQGVLLKAWNGKAEHTYLSHEGMPMEYRCFRLHRFDTDLRFDEKLVIVGRVADCWC